MLTILILIALLLAFGGFSGFVVGSLALTLKVLLLVVLVMLVVSFIRGRSAPLE